ncbi:phosphoribosyltransferase family protein [Polluticoccus soli]|uniref:phosphoribosyltransferase family protein n=1 Tax=Polluticoccus soli TaxID=3034150 RepID=UPI0023E1E112|nr:phosphoribosyltransferase family protein [Flavipsychrobacter sp. JY13-12]
MSKQRVLILDKERISWKLQRMAYEVLEHNSQETAITLVGIQGTGLAVAKSLAEKLKEISKLKVEVLPIQMNKKQPLKEEITINGELAGKTVLLVDDVANSGKTLLYALKPMLEFETKKIMIAVLVDRRHKSYPISPDIVGYSIATTLQEHIEVETDGDTISAAYLQ